MRAARRLALVARLAETWVRRPATPVRLVMSLTRRCNLRCHMCRTWNLPPGAELGAQEIGALLAQMSHLTWLDLTGGEPMLRRDAVAVFDAVSDATPALHVLHFPTNGWFPDRAVDVARLVRRRRPEVDLLVTVSIDGPRPVHDAVRGRRGSFDRALETVRGLREVPGVKTYVGTTITAHTADALPALGDALAAEVPGFAPHEWHWNWMQISEHFFGNGALAAEPPVKADGCVAAHLGRRGVPRGLVDLMETAFLVNLEFYRRGEAAGMTCQALRSAAFVSAAGDLYPCHVYDRPLGSLRNAAVRDRWHAPATLAARRDIERLACGGCFSPCEAYPMLAGAPVEALTRTVWRAARLLREHARGARGRTDGMSRSARRGHPARQGRP